MSAPENAGGGWVRTCRLAGLGEDSPVHADIGECPVCLVRTGGAVYALRDECTHESVPLSYGDVAGGAIECWKHGSRFDLATGRVLSPPATRPVAVLWRPDRRRGRLRAAEPRRERRVSAAAGRPAARCSRTQRSWLV
jgi:3-phenylpropionate/trans-cinnamate dioxygenase ferredoxin subunit